MLCLALSACAGLYPGVGSAQEGREVEEEHSDEGHDADVKVAALLDDNSTKDMHDDSTILRNVSVLDDKGLELFGALRIWAGGALQYDYHNIEGIYQHENNGEHSEQAGFRRLEGILRSQLFNWGELKVQYDFDEGIFRDLYLRWVSDRPITPITVTIGNQKEPMGLDNLTGNKFEVSQERSAPSHAFGSWRSLGVRLHKAFQLEADKRKLDIFEEDDAFLTTSIGVFTQDIEESHDTDLAVTGRITGGRRRDGIGMHLGFSASYREGEFYRISFRPEVREANRITLAWPESNTQGILGAEAVYNKGRFHTQAEAYYSEYRGRVDGYGGGAYLLAGWFLTSDSREYNARWGIMAPHRPSGRFSTEIFARLSHTRGDDNVNGWNDYKSLTLGLNATYRKLRGSLNVLYGESREALNTEDDGIAVVLRAQYLF